MRALGDHPQPAREQRFLKRIENTKYDRQIVNGLKKFIDHKVPDDMRSFYGRDELAALIRLKDTSRDVEARMPVKITRHYFEMARHSKPLQHLVKASPRESADLAGTPDPGQQLHYSPVEGLLHKYELALIYVTATCSAHCRFCYREELIAGKDIPRSDGSMAPKGLAQIPQTVAYIREHNRRVAANGGAHPESGLPRLREILLSGGDPMVLSNRKLGAWLAALAEAGIDAIRIGTKELAFFPDRFDATFFDMLDNFHELYPHVRIRLMVQFNHPDEFLLKGADGEWRSAGERGFIWRDNTRGAVERIGSRHWISLDNQAPIIKDINDDALALGVLQRELRRAGIENHYFFCGRDIVGHKSFNVPIERAWHLLNESQKGLSGVEAHARLALSHYRGKLEVAAVIPGSLPQVAGGEDGIVLFKLLRSPADARTRSAVTMVGRNPDAIWVDGYEDRIIHDGAGIFGAPPESLAASGKQRLSAMKAAASA